MKRLAFTRLAPVVVTLGVVALVVASGVDLAESAGHIAAADPRWLVASVAAVLLMRLLRAWRWAGLFPLVGLPRPPYRRQLHIILAADFVNSFLPRAATMAGRALLAGRVYSVGLGAVTATLVLELLIDVTVMLVLAAGLLPYLLYPQHAVLAASVIVLPAITLGAIGRLPFPAIGGASRLQRIPLPARLRDPMPALASRPREAVGPLLTQALVVTVAIHACRIAAFVAVGYSLGGLPVLAVVAATVIATPAQLFPFTIGGAGVREGLLILVLARFGVAPELGVALGVAVLLVSSGSALVGGAVVPSLLLTRKRPLAAPEIVERGSAT